MRTITMALLCLTLLACGGGGGDTPENNKGADTGSNPNRSVATLMTPPVNSLLSAELMPPSEDTFSADLLPPG